MKNKDLIKSINNILNTEEYKGFKLEYILQNIEEKENVIAIAVKDDEMIDINPFTKEVNNVPDWAYSFDIDIFEELEWNKEIVYMTPEVHYSIWVELNKFYPEEYEHMEGINMYLKYCKKNNITKDKINKEIKGEKVEDIMRFDKNKNIDKER